MTLAAAFEVQECAGLKTGHLAHRTKRGFRSIAGGSRVHDNAKRHHILGALVQKHRTSLLGEKREPEVPAAYVVYPCQSRYENVLHCDVLHKWSLIAVHDFLCLPHRRSPARPPLGQYAQNLDYQKLYSGVSHDFDGIVTFDAPTGHRGAA
jgi:hypothetical protein